MADLSDEEDENASDCDEQLPLGVVGATPRNGAKQSAAMSAEDDGDLDGTPFFTNEALTCTPVLRHALHAPSSSNTAASHPADTVLRHHAHA